MEIYRLIYKSRATVPVDIDLIMSICRQSQRRNKALDVTGLLLATETHFFQVLEGSQAAVNAVYSAISKDGRHTGLVLVSYRVVPNRVYEDWAMKGFGLMSFQDDLGELLKKKYGVENGGVRFPIDETRALSFLAEVGARMADD